MKSAPSIAVVIPVYNGADFVRQAIQSALSQTHPADEIIVFDDASSDATCDVLAAYEGHPLIRMHRLAQWVNAPTAWNQAVRMSCADYFVVLGHDDVLHPGFIADIVKAITDAPDAGFIVTGYRLIDARGTLVENRPICRPELLGRTSFDVFFNEMVVRGSMYFRASSNVVRRAAFDAVDGFDERMLANFDYDFYLRLAGTTPTFGLEGMLVDYRMHSANLTTAHFMEEKGDCDVIFAKMIAYSMLTERQKAQLVENISLFQFQYFSRKIRSAHVSWPQIRQARSTIRSRLRSWARSDSQYGCHVRTRPSRLAQRIAWRIGSTRIGVSCIRWALRAAPSVRTLVRDLAHWVRNARATWPSTTAASARSNDAV
jgi:glycosyltransferase involved in cell wall biosynthesis